jgi:uncharacterized protein YeaO (DUF488 family)
MKETTFTLDRNKVYSSYYAYACKHLPSWRLVSISIDIPQNFEGDILRELNPSNSLLYNYKNNLITDEEYEKTYRFETLSKLNPEEIYNKVKGKVILCYCGKDKFCHRHIVMKWLQENLGEEIIGGEV